MTNITKALTTAIENSRKVANTPIFSTVIDKLLGFKISEWGAQGETIKKQIMDGYEDAKQKGLGLQYVSAFRSNANLINIGEKAAKYIDPNKSNNTATDNDVFWGLIDHSKNISDEEMQELIAKIIAGEYNQPGTYSMSTLQIIKMLDRNELQLFEKMGSLVINSDEIPQALFNFGEKVQEMMHRFGIDFGSLQALQSLGLVLPNDMTRSVPNPDKKLYVITYFDKKFIFEPENENYQKIKIPGFYGLSVVGTQLLKHLKPPFVEKYYQWLKENYKIPNYRLKND